MTAPEGKVKAGHEALKTAAKALADLNTFSIVVATLEGGHLHAPSYTDSDRIIKICKAAMAKRLREHDRAMAKAVSLLSGTRHTIDHRGRLSRVGKGG